MVPYTTTVKVPYTVTECVPCTVCKKVKTCVPVQVQVQRCRKVACDPAPAARPMLHHDLLPALLRNQVLQETLLQEGKVLLSLLRILLHDQLLPELLRLLLHQEGVLQADVLPAVLLRAMLHHHLQHLL